MTRPRSLLAVCLGVLAVGAFVWIWRSRGLPAVPEKGNALYRTPQPTWKDAERWDLAPNASWPRDESGAWIHPAFADNPDVKVGRIAKYNYNSWLALRVPEPMIWLSLAGDNAPPPAPPRVTASTFYVDLPGSALKRGISGSMEWRGEHVWLLVQGSDADQLLLGMILGEPARLVRTDDAGKEKWSLPLRASEADRKLLQALRGNLPGDRVLAPSPGS